MAIPGEELARKAAQAAEDKKANDVVILDVRELTP
ncbi:MAG: ribosome silencing factor RsfS, partial [Limnochordales bacterium]|nr:ribosome silencing factor RsfS [Limnochordales bacterium]